MVRSPLIGLVVTVPVRARSSCRIQVVGFLTTPLPCDCVIQMADTRPDLVNGFFHVTQFAIAEMEKQGSGHVVSITTSLVNHALDGVPSVLASLTKGGLDAATKSLAIEYAKRGIRANAVAPGIIKTPMHAPETHSSLAGLHPVNRMGEINDIVEGVLYLESAGFVTGEILHVDGGQSAGH
jgi:NAD(P)-dependent dehydrogenase (short-subunit alcohol dehydrogenase family)